MRGAQFHRILVPTDGSEGAQRAVNAAVELARATGGRVIALHVVPPPVADTAFTGLGMIGGAVPLDAGAEAVPPMQDTALLAVRSAAHQAGVRVESEQVTDLRPAQAIAERAEAWNCDLIVMHSQGYGGLLSAILGSTTARVFNGCEVPVLLVH